MGPRRGGVFPLGRNGDVANFAFLNSLLSSYFLFPKKIFFLIFSFLVLFSNIYIYIYIFRSGSSGLVLVS